MDTQSTTSKTIKSLSTQTIMTLILAILSLVSFSIMSRLLTKDDFGYYAAIVAITTIFQTLTEAGMGAAVIQKKEVTNGFVDTAFSLSLLTGAIFSGLLVLLSGVLASTVADESMAMPLRLMAICIFFCSLNSVTKANWTRRLEFKRIGIYNIIAEIATIILGVISAYMGLGVYAIIIQTISHSIFVFLIFYQNLEYKPRWFHIEIQAAKEIFTYGGWLTASCIFRAIYQQMDKLLMGRWLSISALGSYNRPSGFINQISNKLNGILDTVLFPILSSIQDDKEKIKRAYDKLLYMINLYSSMLFILFIMGCKLIIDIFFGSEWQNLSLVFCILSLSLLLSVNGRIMDCFIRSLALVKMGFYLRIIACLITFACLYVGKDYGIEGVAFSVVISNYLIIFSKLWYIGRKVDISLSRTIGIMFKPYIISVLPLAVYIAFYSEISSSFIWSLTGTLLTVIYYISLIICFPTVAGDYIMNFIYKKAPALKKLRIK